MTYIKHLIKKILQKIIGYEFYEKKIFLEGAKFAFLQRNMKFIKNLSDAEFSVFSQWGDDGIINWLINSLPIKNKIFVEIGTEDYKESNTRFVLKYRNWSGHLIDSNLEQIKKISDQSVKWKYDLNTHNFKINKDNINKFFKKLKLPKEIGLMSLDIDGIDYWAWKELNEVRPVIFVCEFNSIFGDKKAVTVPYDKNFNRTSFHFSNLAFGASIEAFKYISNKKNYIYLGTNSNGVNAYFLEKKYYKFIKNKIKSHKSFPSKTRESRDKNYKKNFTRSKNRFKDILGIKLIDVKKNKYIKLKNIDNFYSQKWIN